MTVVSANGEFFRRSLETLYTEALLLSDETRAYFDGEGRAARERLPPFDRVQFACEALKATTRTLQVIAWLASSRAASADIPAFPPASASTPEVLGCLPFDARRLILAGIELHERACRLASGSDAPIAIGSPARALIQRVERSI